MADRKIEIQMATVGAAEAAAGVNQATEAVKGLTASQDESFAKMKEQVAAEAEAAKARAEQARERADQADKEAEEIGKSERAHNDRSAEIGKAVGAIAVAAKFAFEALSNVATAIDSVDMEQLNRLDPKVGAEFEKISFWSKAATSPIQGLIDATSEWLTGDTVGGAFKAMNEALAAAAQQHEENVDRMITAGTRQTGEIKAMADAVKAANEILNAKDNADSAARSRADAAAIRGGADPTETAIATAKYEADQQVASIEREAGAANQAAQVANDNADAAVNNAVRIDYDPTATPADRAKASEAAKAAQAERDRQSAVAATARRMAAERIRAVRETQNATTEKLRGDRDAKEAGDFEKGYNDFSRGFEADEKRNLDLEKRDREALARASQQMAAASAKAGTATVSAMEKSTKGYEDLSKRMATLEARVSNQRHGR